MGLNCACRSALRRRRGRPQWRGSRRPTIRRRLRGSRPQRRPRGELRSGRAEARGHRARLQTHASEPMQLMHTRAGKRRNWPRLQPRRSLLPPLRLLRHQRARARCGTLATTTGRRSRSLCGPRRGAPAGARTTRWRVSDAPRSLAAAPQALHAAQGRRARRVQRPHPDRRGVAHRRGLRVHPQGVRSDAGSLPRRCTAAYPPCRRRAASSSSSSSPSSSSGRGRSSARTAT